MEEVDDSADSETYVSRLTSTEIRNLLREKGLQLGGSKQELVDRYMNRNNETNEDKMMRMTVKQLKTDLASQNYSIIGMKDDLRDRHRQSFNWA